MASPMSPDAEPLLGATGVGGEVRKLAFRQRGGSRV
jgi:hypothetical protein